jgi:hypothetical protein
MRQGARLVDYAAGNGARAPNCYLLTIQILEFLMGRHRPIGEILRDWRIRRRLSQLALACDAEISTRHLSFLETGRA